MHACMYVCIVYVCRQIHEEQVNKCPIHEGNLRIAGEAAIEIVIEVFTITPLVVYKEGQYPHRSLLKS